MQSITVSAPGRINLIGEHTDYNNGFVLPAAIQMAATATITKRADDQIHLEAIDLNETFIIDSLASLSISEKQWANYMIGVIVQFVKKQKFPTGFNISLSSNVPIGAGLSSSAAIECAIAFGLNELFAFNIDKMKEHCSRNKFYNGTSNEFVFELTRDLNDPIKDVFPFIFY